MMKKIFSICCFLLASCGFLSAQNIEVESNASAVTIYIQNAQVTRNKKVDLPQGRSTVVFKNLSPFIEPKSIQIKTKGSAMVMSVKMEKDYTEFIKQMEADTIDRAIQKVNDELKVLKTKVEIIDDEIAFLNTNKSIGSVNNGMNVNDLKLATQFYQEKISALKLKKLDMNAEILALNSRIDQLRAYQSKTKEKKIYPKGEIWVEMDAPVAGQADFQVTYVVSNAGWFPKYDVRVKDISQPLQLLYKAQVSQNTQENWKNVKLKFSTANPNVSGKMTNIKPYYINYNSRSPIYQNQDVSTGATVKDLATGEPLIGANVMVKGTTLGTVTDVDGKYNLVLPQGQQTLVFSYIGYKTREVIVYGNLPDVSLEEDDTQLQEVVVAASSYGRSIKKDKALSEATYSVTNYNISTLSTSPTVFQPTVAEFEIDEPFNLPSDGKAYTLNIKKLELPATYTYYCAPKVEKAAYLTAGITNWEQYQLQDGEVSVFYEDTYIGKALLSTGSDQDTLIFSLGKDNGVLVTRDIQKQNTGKKMLSTKKEDTRSWVIVLKNNKLNDIQLILSDQVPVSTLEEIEVSIEETTGGQVDAATGIVTWNLTIPSAQKKEIILRYTVKYPKNRVLIVD